MIELHAISLSTLGLLAVLGLGLFGLFSLLRYLIIPRFSSRKKRRVWRYVLFRAEIAGWFGFGLYALYRLLLEAPLPTLFLSTFVLVGGWWWWRDYVPGLLFRFEQDARAGDYILYRGQACAIAAIRPRNLKLIGQDGQLIILPYRSLEAVVLTEAAQMTTLTPFTVQVESDIPNAADKIERLLQESPWVIPAHPPRVKDLGDGTYEITSLAPDEAIREKQQQHFSSLNL